MVQLFFHGVKLNKRNLTIDTIRFLTNILLGLEFEMHDKNEYGRSDYISSLQGNVNQLTSLLPSYIDLAFKMTKNADYSVLCQQLAEVQRSIINGRSKASIDIRICSIILKNDFNNLEKDLQLLIDCVQIIHVKNIDKSFLVLIILKKTIETEKIENATHYCQLVENAINKLDKLRAEQREKVKRLVSDPLPSFGVSQVQPMSFFSPSIASSGNNNINNHNGQAPQDPKKQQKK